MKPLIDYAQSRRRLLGIADLPIRTVFDIGANEGKMARLYRKRFPEARIYCVEPVPPCRARIEQWARKQNGRVVVIERALGSAPGTATFFWNVRHTGGSSLIAPRDVAERVACGHCRQIEVEVETLDQLASRLPIEDQILVKIDVEGNDLEVIRGGAETLSRASAVIVEVALLESPGSRPGFEEFVGALAEMGLLYRGHLGCAWVDGIPRLADAVFIRPPAFRRQAA